jgi:hypothetical protein
MPARELPPRPSLEQYKKLAKELIKAFRSGDSAALQRLRAHHPHLARDTFELADAQLVVAREHGIDSWPKLNSPERGDYAAVIDSLLTAGARIEPGMTEWWRTEASCAAAYTRVLQLLEGHSHRS